MPTEVKTLTKTPVQITNGTNSALIQSISNRNFSFAHSDTSPDTSVPSHTAREISVASPFKVWIWSGAETDVKVVVSVA